MENQPTSPEPSSAPGAEAPTNINQNTEQAIAVPVAMPASEATINPTPAPAPTTTPAPVVVPTSAPVGGVASSPAEQQNPAGLVVLQWLTYAFWGWTVSALSTVIGAVLAHFMSGVDSGFLLCTQSQLRWCYCR